MFGASKIVWACGAIGVVGCATFPGGQPRWPEPRQAATVPVAPPRSDAVEWQPLGTVGNSEAATISDGIAGSAALADAARIEQQPVCVGAKRWSAGNLGDTILYRHHRAGNRLAVGYFVYWSTERPWGNNLLSYTLVPALLIDAAYSHFLYVLPGVKDVLHGAADVEGVRVELEDRDGKLAVIGGTADDGFHHSVKLSRDDLVDSQGRIVLLTDIWSHQLGGHGGGSFAPGPRRPLRCYDGPMLRPMTNEIAEAFRLGSEASPRRAKPAWRTKMVSSRTPAG